MKEHPTGIYEVVNSDGVFIRREPRIVEIGRSNKVGRLTFGTQRRIYDTTTDSLNQTWGRVSEADAAGIAEWVCIQGLNRTYMKCIKPDPDPVDMLLAQISQLETRIDGLEIRLSALERQHNR